MVVLTNNPRKYYGLSGYGLEVTDQIPLVVPSNAHNERYLRAKQDKLGHSLDLDGARRPVLRATAGPLSARVRGARVHDGRLDASGMRIGIVVSRFNDIVSSPLLEGAVEAPRGPRRSADRHRGGMGARRLRDPHRRARARASTAGVDAVVCLGAVIRGDTAHFDYVAGEAARGIASVHATTGVPATFGVLTVDTLEQAMDRAGGKHGNKGAEAAVTAVEMVVAASRAASVARPPEQRAVS